VTLVDEGEAGELVAILREQLERERAARDEAERALIDHRRYETLLSAQRQVFEQIARGETLPAILDTLVRLIEHQSSSKVLAAIHLVDAESGALRHGAAPRLSEAFNEALDGVQLADSPFAPGAVDNVDIANSEPWAGLRMLAADEGLLTYSCTPIQGQDARILGVFALYCLDATGADSERRALVELFSQAAATAIERVRALDDLKLEKANVERLYEVGQAVNRGRDLQDIVQMATDAATELCAARFGAFFYTAIDQSGESLQLYTLAGVSGDAFARFPMPRNTQIFDPTFQGIGIKRSADITLDPAFGHNTPYSGLPDGHPPVRSYLAVPVILSDGEVVGGMFLGHGQPNRFTADHERLVQGIATQAAIAIDNVRLLEAERRARAEAEQRADAARSLHYVGDGVFLVDDDDRIQLWNPAAARLIGIEEPQAIGQSPTDTIPGWEMIVGAIPVVDGEGPDVRHRPRMLPLELGTGELWISIHGVSFPGGVVYAMRDATEDYQLEQMRSNIVATVSHELRTPIASVYGAAQTLGRSELELGPETEQALMGIITSESERLTRIVDDVLLTSRLGGGIRLQHETVDLAAMALSVAEAADVRTGGAVRFEVDVPVEPVMAAADGAKLRQVLVNLVENAIKYGSSGGVVRIEVRALTGGAQCCVSDEGPGIPSAHHEHIFERFYRLDPDMSTGITGSGLGLYICRELVDRMGGSLWVESAPGAGARFFVELT
jgi:signal transduction histidine kinase